MQAPRGRTGSPRASARAERRLEGLPGPGGALLSSARKTSQSRVVHPLCRALGPGRVASASDWYVKSAPRAARPATLRRRDVRRAGVRAFGQSSLGAASNHCKPAAVHVPAARLHPRAGLLASQRELTACRGLRRATVRPYDVTVRLNLQRLLPWLGHGGGHLPGIVDASDDPSFGVDAGGDAVHRLGADEVFDPRHRCRRRGGCRGGRARRRLRPRHRWQCHLARDRQCRSDNVHDVPPARTASDVRGIPGRSSSTTLARNGRCEGPSGSRPRRSFPASSSVECEDSRALSISAVLSDGFIRRPRARPLLPCRAGHRDVLSSTVGNLVVTAEPMKTGTVPEYRGSPSAALGSRR